MNAHPLLRTGTALAGVAGALVLAGCSGAADAQDGPEPGVTPSDATAPYADGEYTAEGTLVARRLAGALLTDTDAVVRRIEQLVATGTVTAADGTSVKIECDSICVHGDSPGAVAMALAVRAALEGAGVAVGPFVR